MNLPLDLQTRQAIPHLAFLRYPHPRTYYGSPLIHHLSLQPFEILPHLSLQTALILLPVDSIGPTRLGVPTSFFYFHLHIFVHSVLPAWNVHSVPSLPAPSDSSEFLKSLHFIHSLEVYMLTVSFMPTWGSALALTTHELPVEGGRQTPETE